MKRKVLLSFFVILLILALTGCGMIPEGLPEWMEAEDTVYLYWQAITNRQYELAKHYCITDGIWYNKTDEWEEYININSEGEASVLVSEPYFYKQAEVIGNNAIVYIWIFAHKIAFPDSTTIDVDTFEYEVELIKETSPPGSWELK
jgi:hypothetical protein